MTTFTRMNGLIAAPYTPFTADGALRLTGIERQAELLAAEGVSAVFICGTTGEGVSMTTDERMAVAQRWVEACRKSLHVIVHVGHNSQADAVALAAQAERIGASAIAAMPPVFFRPTNLEQLVGFFRPVVNAAPGRPFYYYHIPSMSGVSVGIAEFLRLARRILPTFRGVKFTHLDLMEYQLCLEVAGEELDLGWGGDELLLPALSVGATSAVGSTYNYAAPLYQRLIAAFRSGDWATARAFSRLACQMVEVLMHYGVLRTGKATMKLIGLDCGPTRAPVAALTPAELDAVQTQFQRLGLLAPGSAGPRMLAPSNLPSGEKR